MIFLGRQINEERDYSEHTAEAIDAEVTRLIADARTTAEAVLKKNRATLDKLVAELLVKETLEREEFEKLVGPRPIALKQNQKSRPIFFEAVFITVSMADFLFSSAKATEDLPQALLRRFLPGISSVLLKTQQYL